jgi:hypothetical protein
VDEHTISPAGDPFYAASHDQDHPHACLDGYVLLEYTVFDEESGEEVERVVALPRRRRRWRRGIEGANQSRVS